MGHLIDGVFPSKGMQRSNPTLVEILPLNVEVLEIEGTDSPELKSVSHGRVNRACRKVAYSNLSR